MGIEVDCSDSFTDSIQKQVCHKNIQDPDDYAKFKLISAKCNCDKAKIKPVTKAEDKNENFYLLEVMVERIKLIPEPVEENDEDEFLDEETKKRKEEEEERKRKMKAKLLARIKFADFPTMEIEQEEYKEPDTRKPKKVFQEWTHDEDEDEDEDKDWMAELKERMKRIEKEERDKEEEKNRPPDTSAEEKEKQERRLENEKFIGKSCFFSFIPSQLIKAINERKMEISLYQMGDVLTSTRSKLIGEASVSLRGVFSSAIKRASCPMIKSPVVASIIDDYEIRSMREHKVKATISVYIRIVCMGYAEYPEKKNIPKPVTKKVSEIETLVTNLKALGSDELKKTCPMLKEFREPKDHK